jgi:alkanesulfonate monooxygenase SsuD/methylene tetrahydromethanopterin reductase-like flavin-dependent oxidoreductase (luciferase family)
MMPVEAYQQKLNALAGHCRAVGRNPSDIRKSLVMQALVGDDRAALDRQAEQLRARGQQGLTGTPEQVAEQIMRYVDLGVGDFILGTRPPYDFNNLQTFIERVAPLVRKEAERRSALKAM